MKPLFLVLAVVIGLASITSCSAQDPLPSWNDTASKKAIIAFVEKVTKQGGADFVPPAERIAVFDNDGTLWCENPVPFQAAFAVAEIKRQLPEHPDWKKEPAVQAMEKGDIAALTGDHHKGLMKLLALSHAGITTDEFDSRVKSWLATAIHPRFNNHYSECVYQPMLELLAYLRANEFRTWIVSGGGIDFMRVFAEDTYGIPPEQVVGSYGQVKFSITEGKPTLTKSIDTLFIDDREGKPVAIHQFIGRRPIAAFGNSDGDQAMIEYATIGNPRPSFGLIVHHTDDEREYAYDAKPKSSGKLITALEAAKKHGWTLVSMKEDWKSVWNESKLNLPKVSARSLFGKWLAEDISGQGVIDNAQSTLEISQDGSVAGDTCVNRFGGKAKIDGQKILFGPLAMTRRAGPQALMDQESKYATALEKVTGFRVDLRGLLFLVNAEGQDVIRFSKMAD